MYNRQTKVFLIKSFAFTPFCNNDDLEYLERNGIVITEDISNADIIISQNLKHLKKIFWKFWNRKKFLIWTLEPRFDTSFKERKKYLFGAVTCHFMNVYTKNVFTSGLTFHSQHIRKILENIPDTIHLKNRKIAALISHFDGVKTPPLMRNGKNIDLIGLRSQIALEGYKKGLLSIYGKGWPDGIATEDSREGDWKTRKGEILKNYSFNLCFENTIAPNYITEKIWDSIENYCLPIYYGKGNDIYKIFPLNSFLDYANFQGPGELFKYIETMKEEEYRDRLNLCISVYRDIMKKGPDFSWERRKESLDAIISNFSMIAQNEAPRHNFFKNQQD